MRLSRYKQIQAAAFVGQTIHCIISNQSCIISSQTTVSRLTYSIELCSIQVLRRYISLAGSTLSTVGVLEQPVPTATLQHLVILPPQVQDLQMFGHWRCIVLPPLENDSPFFEQLVFPFYLLTLLPKPGHLQLENSAFYAMVKRNFVFKC